MAEAPKIPATVETYNIIKAMIVNFELPPGQLLLVQPLTQRLGASRTPVREAIIRLKEENLVEDAPGRKFRVTPLTQKAVDDIYNARRIIEREALRRATERLDDRRIREFERSVQASRRCLDHGDIGGFFEEDHRFHDLILALDDNRVFLDCIRRHKDNMQRIRRLTASSPVRLDAVVGEHQAIVLRLKDRDSAGAVRAMDRHLEESVANAREWRKHNSCGILAGRETAVDAT
ncbi:MAG: GntR family transcriptional regulator [Planctomycetes bacterium]|nr:GntR family transcriptional regulator [Planctomycetota bacterium]